MDNLHKLLDGVYSVSLGFEPIFRSINDHFSSTTKYPPYNIVRISENRLLVEVAVAGFAREDIEVEVKKNVLYVRGKKPKNDKENDIKYYHRGISTRSFILSWAIADNIQVNGATLNDGILRINLERLIPDDDKAKKIEVK